MKCVSCSGIIRAMIGKIIPASETRHANGWLHCPCDSGLLFDGDVEDKYDLALAKIGIDAARLVNDSGRA